MKKIGSFLSKKNLTRRTVIDQQSVFCVFQLVIKEEYGRQGAGNIKAVSFRDKKIFIEAAGANWASEIWAQRKQIVKKINQQLGSEEIIDLAIE